MLVLSWLVLVCFCLLSLGALVGDKSPSDEELKTFLRRSIGTLGSLWRSAT